MAGNVSIEKTFENLVYKNSEKGNIDQLSATAVLAVHRNSRLFARVKKDEGSDGDSGSEEDSYLNADLGNLSSFLTREYLLIISRCDGLDDEN